MRLDAMEKRQDSTEDLIDALLSWKTTMEEANKLQIKLLESQMEMIAQAEKVIRAVSGLVWLGNGIKWLSGVLAATGICYAVIKGWLS